MVDIIYKRTSFENIVQSDFFRYVGSKEMLKSFIKAFDLDDRHVMIENDYKDLGFKYFGVRIFNAMMFIIGASAFFMNYFSGLYILFPACYGMKSQKPRILEPARRMRAEPSIGRLPLRHF